ncbi:anthranilate synthase component I family protein [Nocardioides sp. LMS-CY]|uniref:anthranilate synthase component I family protein n=1 Tax=Nocardioides sp. (strain LMS-CY) TaxID=2840457 RepID=UPI001C005DCB|nr:anthranilate synthase component I family protein [Nocardioides sp. LMS-CY]QWF22001.1 anthranilate synthase component I family protein [Nocardioides sp. LMS-CY]
MTDPVPDFRAVAAAHARCFWLDGGGAREWSGRRSILGWLDDDDVSLTYDAGARVVRRHVGGRSEVVGDDVFDVLAAELAAGPADASWFGYLGYACRPDLPAATGGELPDAVWMRPSHVQMFEHEVDGDGGFEAQARGAFAPQPPMRVVEVRGAPATNLETATPATYRTGFARVQEQLHAGNTYEVNLTYRMATESDLDPVSAYLRLRGLNPAPYAGFLQHDVPGARAWLLSSSPERYALVSTDRTLETRPIKGTTPRGATAAQDEEARERLRTDPRFRAENLMIVDLLRNDLSMVCEPGTVTVPTLMDVESYESVHQLVSTVRGRLRDEVSTIDALRVLFPAGSMTGAPKLRTMQVIEQVEQTPRGPYAGAFGWIGADGRADLGVVIRSLATAGDGRYLLGTGGGITVRSDVDEEWAESRWKAERLLRVFDRP